ncbi:MAG: 2-hydroxychromene-2-carboxylate isomerase [Myxococcota bacterium]
MTLSIDVYWSFRSPYSYLATPRLVEMAAVYDLAVNVRPVYPIAVRLPDFFATVNPLWPPYLVRDCIRIAEHQGIAFGWPQPDPIVQTSIGGRLVTADEQPYIRRLTRLGQLASERRRGLPFIAWVSHLIWSGEVRGWNEGDHLARSAERAGLDLAEMDAILDAEGERLEAAIQQNQRDHEASGHWGVPTCVFEAEPFFGQDRLELLLWRLKQQGLRER